MLGHCNLEEVALYLHRPRLAAPNLKTLISPAKGDFGGYSAFQNPSGIRYQPFSLAGNRLLSC